MLLMNFKINLDLNWSKKCLKMATNVANQAATVSLTEAKLYVSIVTLLTQDNAKVGEKLKSGFKITINWDRYQLKIWTKRPN